MVRMRAAFVLLALLLAGPVTRAAPSPETLKTFDACVRFVRNAPHNRARTDVDWEALRRKWRPLADATEPGEPLRDLLNAMLATVGASHTAVLDREVYEGMMAELQGQATPTFGLLLEETGAGTLFVRAMYERGAAERAGLAVGDEIVAIDAERPLESEAIVDAGYDPAPDRARLFFLRPSAGEVDLSIRSSAHARPRAVTLAPEPTSGLAAGRRSVRIVERGGKKIGVLHLWMVARGSAGFVQEALKGELAGCDAVVLDLRGRGGYADEIAGILAPFRTAHRKARAHDGGFWKKPVVFLIDDRSRSAKELLAWNIRNENLGPLVGEKTEGAVLGAGFMPLPGDLFLEVGMIEVPVADGSSLEGVGVEPTVEVAHAGAYARGRDPILEKGLELARAAVKRPRIAGPY
jgi:C-terminal processing protease CtpA/Prc